MMPDHMWAPVITSAAERVAAWLANKYAIVQPEAYQDCWVVALEHRKLLETTIRETPDLVFPALLRRMKHHYFKRRIAEQCESGAYYYEPEYVRLFLPYAFALEDWPEGPVPGDLAPEWRTGEAIDTAIDITLAWPRIREHERRIIVVRSLAHPDVTGRVDWEAVANECGRRSGSAAREAFYAAVRSLTYHMNNELAIRAREHEGPGPRKKHLMMKAEY